MVRTVWPVSTHTSTSLCCVCVYGAGGVYPSPSCCYSPIAVPGCPSLTEVPSTKGGPLAQGSGAPGKTHSPRLTGLRVWGASSFEVSGSQSHGLTSSFTSSWASLSPLQVFPEMHTFINCFQKTSGTLLLGNLIWGTTYWDPDLNLGFDPDHQAFWCHCYLAQWLSGVVLLLTSHLLNKPLPVFFNSLLFWPSRRKFHGVWLDTVCLSIIYNPEYVVSKSRPTLCDPMDCSVPGFPALHHLLEFAQTHVH